MKVLLDHQFFDNCKIDVINVNVLDDGYGTVESYDVRVLLEDENNNQLQFKQLNIPPVEHIKAYVLQVLELTERVEE